ncbi:MAG TPA: hypothetical protein VKA83_01320 [Methylomirabilota bacterium]|jgi:hypothetical protein|nr:hypothetical protein [Methylomirabilota bacterium]
MFEDRAKVLLILPQDVLDRARVFAGEAMTKLKGPVSLQMVLRALIDEGLRRERDRALLTNIEVQMRAVREVRSRGRRPAALARAARTGARASGRRS